MKGRLYTLARHNPDTGTEQSKFVCVDASTEEKLWEHISSISLTDVPNTRVAWSSCVGDPETGRVYAHGVSGDFCCLEAETGAVVWERKLHEEFGVLSTYGGRTNFPLVFDDLVIASGVIIGWGDSSEWGSLAKPAHRFLSMDTQTGEVHWLKGTGISPYDTTYSTPLFADGKVYHCTNNGWWYILEPTDRGVKVLLKLRLKGQSSDGSPIAAQNRVYLPTSATVYCLATDEPLRFYSWASHDYPASASWDFSPGKEIWYTMKHRGEQCGDSAAISGKI
ncbi:MAG: PQQ-binding-like beta-propeller repeat protein [Planctomycetota bacterium]